MLELVERVVVVQVLLDEVEHFSRQVSVLKHQHLGQGRQGVLL